MQVIAVTGLSGSGKSVAIRQLEDSGYYCIDNLPVDFIVPVIQSLRDRGHPLTPLNREPGDQTGLQEAIAQERSLMSLEDGFVLDTSDLTPSMLKAWIRQFINAPASEMTISFESFAFKKGIPVAADFVFDVRNLPNPYYDTALRPLTGQDKPVIDYLKSQPEVLEMVSDIETFLRKWIPGFRAQGRHYLTICIGCTGGQHRSVFVAEELYRRFSSIAGVVVRHRALKLPRI